MKKPKAFNVYLASAKQIEMLSDQQAGMLIKSLLRHANGEETDMGGDLALELIYSMLADQIDRDFEKYNEICEKRSKAAKASVAQRSVREEEEKAPDYSAYVDKFRQLREEVNRRNK